MSTANLTAVQAAYQVGLVSAISEVLIEDAVNDCLRFYRDHGHDISKISCGYNPCDGMYLLADDTGAYHLRRARSGRYVMNCVGNPSQTLVLLAQNVAKDAGIRV